MDIRIGTAGWSLYRAGEAFPSVGSVLERYAALGLPWIAPELREDRGEIEAAREGRLPHLIELSDLRAVRERPEVRVGSIFGAPAGICTAFARRDHWQR